MKDVLMVMNPRAIPSCIEAIKSLDIPKVWFSAYTEAQLEAEVNRFVEETQYENYLMVSDDLMVDKKSLAMIRRTLEDREVVTGWCRQRPGSKVSNILLRPHGPISLFRFMSMTRYVDAYLPSFSFATLEQVRAQRPVFRTYFVNFCLTGMRRRLWLYYPFKTRNSHGGSDYLASTRLERDKVPMWCVRDAFMEHLKSLAFWKVGKEQPQTVLDL